MTATNEEMFPFFWEFPNFEVLKEETDPIQNERNERSWKKCHKGFYRLEWFLGQRGDNYIFHP